MFVTLNQSPKNKIEFWYLIQSCILKSSVKVGSNGNQEGLNSAYNINLCLEYHETNHV